MDILAKIDQYRFSPMESMDMMEILEVAMFFEQPIDTLNEALDIGGMVKGISSALGVGAHKDREGFLQLTMKAGTKVVKLMWYAAKAAKGDEEAKAKVKELANTEIKKEDILDYLLKLDAIALHTITGPIHIIDALTGWDIWANVKKHATDMKSRAEEAIKNLVAAAKEIEQPDTKVKVSKLVHGIIRLFGLDDKQSLAKGI